MFGRMMVSALALTGVAYAQEAQPTTPPTTTTTTTSETSITPASSTADRLTYEAAQFARYNPQTALDMVRQIPGFSLDGGDDRRGFSGAVGNLLIDGVRPSTKSQGVDGILSRIPANQVVRLEVLRGAAVAGDASGQSMLLNVVRTPTAGSGVYSAGFEITSRDVLAPRGELSYSGRAGNIEYGFGGSIFSQYRDLPGWRLLYDEPGDVYTGRAETPSPRDFRETTLNGNIAFPLFGGRLSATSQLNWWRFHADSDFIFYDAADAFSDSNESVFEEQRRGYEIGLNYERDLGQWSMALIGLVNRGLYTSEEDGDITGIPGFDDYYQDLRQETGETIFRATLARPMGSRQRIEFGGEAALNTLDQGLIFAINGVPEDLDNDNVTIEEERAELFASHTWRPTDRWTLETRLNWETSTLTFTGDTNDVVELSYWKPSVQLSHTFLGNNQLRVRVYRDVGQLDFGDFTTAAAVADDLIAGGNPELVPQTAWIAELGGDLRFPGGSALSFTLARHEISDVSDLVLIEDDRGTLDPLDDIFYDAPGNIGDGEMTRLDVNFSTPVPFVEGGRLTLVGMLADTEVTDPVTNQPRIISYTPESRYEINFRQDLPDLKFAWGLSIFREGEIQAYRFNEIDTSEEGPWIDLFVETTALPYGMKLRAWAANLFDGTVYRDRRFFEQDGPAPGPDPLGRNGDNTRRDYRQREFARAPWFIMELSGTF